MVTASTSSVRGNDRQVEKMRRSAPGAAHAAHRAGMTTAKQTAAAASRALHAAHQHIRISEIYLLSGRVHKKVLVERFKRAGTAITESLDQSGVDMDTLDPSDRGLLQSVLWVGTNPANGTYTDQAVRAAARLADHLAALDQERTR